MSICSSGASHAKAGVPPGVVVDQTYMQSILPPEIAWLYPILPYSRSLLIGDVAAFCAVDPPSFTVPSALEIANFLTGGPLNDYLTVNDFVDNIVKYYLWYRLCECTSGTTPSPATGPSEPTGAPVINPPTLVTGPLVSPCATWTVSGGGAAGGADFRPYLNEPLPPGATSVRISQTQHPDSSASNSTNETAFSTSPLSPVSYVQRNTAGSLNTRRGGTPPDVMFKQTVATWPSTDKQFILNDGTSATGGVPADTVTFVLEWFCGTTPGQGCANCPPDPQLIALLTSMANAITLIQRQAAPFGYIYGTNHAGLSGTGAISVSDLIGVAVDVTTLPSSYGQSAGTPVELFDLGFVTLGTSDGYEQSRRIDHDGTLFLPPAAGVYTTIGYTLHPGVVVSIRELVREP